MGEEDLPFHIQAELVRAMEEVREVFGDMDVKITIVVRSPKIPGGDVVISDDDPQQVAGALLREGSLS